MEKANLKIRLVVIGLALLGWGLLAIDNTQAADIVGKYKMYELKFTAATSPANPFDTYLLRLKITDPDGKTFEIDGFYDGDGNGGQTGNVWKAHICPYKTGEWNWEAVAGDIYDSALVGQKGIFMCVESGDLGGVISDGQHFKFQDGDYVYLVGNFLDYSPPCYNSTTVLLSEDVDDDFRISLIIHHREINKANKFAIHLADNGDKYFYGKSITPWKSNSWGPYDAMALSSWNMYDEYIHLLKNNSMIAQIWFFGDNDVNVNYLSMSDRKRLYRYAMARLSAFSNTMFIISTEYGEWGGNAWSLVNESGYYIKNHNPWKRCLSVHNHDTWNFPNESWPTFIATQDWGMPDRINELAIGMRNNQTLPHINEEFGVVCRGSPPSTDEADFCWLCSLDSHDTMYAKLWANFLGGAAGSGTGVGLMGLQKFLSQSRVPFQRMVADKNHRIIGSHDKRFCLFEEDEEGGHHYVVYSWPYEGFAINISGNGLKKIWFNTLTGKWYSSKRGGWFTLGDGHNLLDYADEISAGRHWVTPPLDPNESRDLLPEHRGQEDVRAAWPGEHRILWITDGSNLNSGVVHPSTDATVTKVTGEYINLTSLKAEWFPFDPYKISGYQYRILQDSPAGPIIKDWTSTNNTSVTADGLSLQNGKSYFFGVKAKNSVGLWSHVVYSDGITVPSNNPPIAKDDTAKTNENTPITIDILVNDYDLDGDVLIIHSITLPAHGSVDIANSPSLIYTPEKNFIGTDTFTYTVSDGNGEISTAKVTVLVEDATPPTVTVISPVYGAYVTSSGFDFIVKAEDPSGIAEVRVSIYDSGRGTNTVFNALANFNSTINQWSFKVLSNYITPGKYAALYVRAKDKVGNWSDWLRWVVNVQTSGY